MGRLGLVLLAGAWPTSGSRRAGPRRRRTPPAPRDERHRFILTVCRTSRCTPRTATSRRSACTRAPPDRALRLAVESVSAAARRGGARSRRCAPRRPTSPSRSSRTRGADRLDGAIDDAYEPRSDGTASRCLSSTRASTRRAPSSRRARRRAAHGRQRVQRLRRAGGQRRRRRPALRGHGRRRFGVAAGAACTASKCSTTTARAPRRSSSTASSTRWRGPYIRDAGRHLHVAQRQLRVLAPRAPRVVTRSRAPSRRASRSRSRRTTTTWTRAARRPRRRRRLSPSARPAPTTRAWFSSYGGCVGVRRPGRHQWRAWRAAANSRCSRAVDGVPTSPARSRRAPSGRRRRARRGRARPRRRS